MRWDYPLLAINPVFCGLVDQEIIIFIIIFIIIIIIIIILIIIIELTHSKTILENTFEVKPQPVALDFKNFFFYSLFYTDILCSSENLQ